MQGCFESLGACASSQGGMDVDLTRSCSSLLLDCSSSPDVGEFWIRALKSRFFGLGAGVSSAYATYQLSFGRRGCDRILIASSIVTKNSSSLYGGSPWRLTNSAAASFSAV
jgi:hypothetical protein